MKTTFVIEIEKAIDWNDGYLNDNSIVGNINDAEKFVSKEDAEDAASSFNMTYDRNGQGRIFARVRELSFGNIQ